MAARATRSASRKARLTEAVATGPLGALSHDELGVIFDGLADPLQPVVAVALSSTCLGLRTPLGAALDVLKQRHERAVALCRKMGTSCAELRVKVVLDWWQDFNNTATLSPVERFSPAIAKLDTEDLATLGMILRTNGLPYLKTLRLDNNDFGDAAMTAFFDGIVSLSLIHISLAFNHFGPAGAESLADALRRGALPKLASLAIGGNVIGTQGMIALAKPLRQLHELVELRVYNCEIGDEGVASLVANLGKDEFKTLSFLDLDGNGLTDSGCATLASALDDEAMPNLIGMLALDEDDVSKAAAALLSESARRRNIDMDPDSGDPSPATP